MDDALRRLERSMEEGDPDARREAWAAILRRGDLDETALRRAALLGNEVAAGLVAVEPPEGLSDLAREVVSWGTDFALLAGIGLLERTLSEPSAAQRAALAAARALVGEEHPAPVAEEGLYRARWSSPEEACRELSSLREHPERLVQVALLVAASAYRAIPASERCLEAGAARARERLADALLPRLLASGA